MGDDFLDLLDQAFLEGQIDGETMVLGNVVLGRIYGAYGIS